MKYARLGKTPFVVSKICFGALPMGPLQSNLSISEGKEVIRTALELGINFIDTAQTYGTYPYISAALKGWNQDVVIATKSYAYTREDMARSLEDARKSLDRDKIDIFELHEQESALTIKGHWEAVEYLLEAKAKGMVGAVGISTHAVDAVRAAANIAEIEVIHPLLNMQGLGILDGTLEEMIEVLRLAASKGKGIYGMKAIGGGNLAGQVKEALIWAFNLDIVHSFAVGMKSEAEVRVNVDWLLEQEPSMEDLKKVLFRKKALHIEEWCLGCGKCAKLCPQQALSIVNKKTVVDEKKCLLCGYCARACRDFCIKVI
ncbi:MAG: aldo/keto reductase [Desulfitobacteriaceae bacterium]|nr:aldo/keto reductase [Desulfitobacteriaceae bacterium]MDD4751819.1 aldo/keto reductase [Desulfitobacteriaceae bacterium]